MLHLVSTIVLVLLALGIYLRKHRPDLHVRLMSSAFVIDLSLVLYIELTRHAIETVATQVKPLIWFHAGISLSVLVLYVVMIVLGRRLLAARAVALATDVGQVNLEQARHTRNLHRNLGMTFCGLRLVNYVTAFMV